MIVIFCNIVLCAGGMSIIAKIGRYKKDKYVILAIFIGFGIAFLVMDNYFAEEDIKKEVLDDFRNAPGQLIGKVKEIVAEDMEPEEIKKIKCGIPLNYTGITSFNFTKGQSEIWSRQVQHDKDLGAIIPEDPCGYRNYSNQTLFKNYTNNLDSTKHWHTGVVLHRIGNIDTVAGTYDMKFQYYVSVVENDTSKYASTDFSEKEPKIDFINMVGEPVLFEKTKGFNQTKNYYDVTVSGKFFTDVDFKEFPFEKIKLNIIAEPAYDTNNASSVFGYDDSQKDSIQLHIWPYYGLLKPDIPSPGYKINSYDFTTYDFQRDKGAEYSRYEASYVVERQFLDSFLKFIFPVLVMTGLAVMTLLFPSEQYMTKISLNALFLIGILLFVQTVQEKIPDTGTMTIFDYIVMTSYTVLIVTIASPALKWHRHKAYEDEKKQREMWLDANKRNHDLNLENLRRTEADILFFEDKLTEHKIDSKEHTRVKKIIKNLKDRRQCLDHLKNIDSEISLIARTRATLCRINIDQKKIRKFIHEEEEENFHKITDIKFKEEFPYQKLTDEEEKEEETKTEERTKGKWVKSATTKLKSENFFNPREIYYMVENFVSEESKEHLTSKQQKHFKNIQNQLESYLKTKEGENKGKIYGRLHAELDTLYYLWNEHGELITREMMRRVNKAGTYDDISVAKKMRNKIIEKLKKLEKKTKDKNGIMIISEGNTFDNNTIELMSKNEKEELSNNENYESRLNYLSFFAIGILTLAGYFYIRYFF